VTRGRRAPRISGVNRATMMSIFALVMELAAAGENALVSSAAGISLPFGFSALGVLAVAGVILLFTYYRMSQEADVPALPRDESGGVAAP